MRGRHQHHRVTSAAQLIMTDRMVRAVLVRPGVYCGPKYWGVVQAASLPWRGADLAQRHVQRRQDDAGQGAAGHAATPYLLVGIDTVVFGLPSRYVNDAACWSEVYQYHYDGGRLAGLSIQPYGDRLVRGLHSRDRRPGPGWSGRHR
jgi:hypothetical protein